ncbi:MAG TPA: ThiF family adenylyltransferase, partial [Dehalococcoidia bacterium]|nr:ThiF family adenylyltransferase [Dehalococcoidia bacterium]
QAKVLLIGAGGLGSPAGLYLAGAGVGRLGLVDSDVVDLSNLQRQVLHRTRDRGRPKTASAADTIGALNPDVEVVQHSLRLTSENIMGVIAGYEMVLDGSDNFATRYLVNDACVLAGKTNIHGSLFQFEGQVTVFLPGKGCYRCLYPTPPPPGSVPSCQEAGVMGVVAGVIGLLQATEALKLILGIGRPLAGYLLTYDALQAEFTRLRFQRNPACPVCGDHPTVTQLIDYEEFCGVRAVGR